MGLVCDVKDDRRYWEYSEVEVEPEVIEGSEDGESGEDDTIELDDSTDGTWATDGTE